MNIFFTLLYQVTIMLILLGIGYLLFRTGKISEDGSKTLGNLLIYLALPCVIINGFFVERTPERLRGLLYSAATAAVLLLAAIIVSRVLFRKDSIAVFAGSFSNPGFFGIPLITAVLSNGAVFYIASFVAFLNLLQWTYGVFLMKREGSEDQHLLTEALTPKKLFTAPFMIAILIGLFFFLTQLPVPGIFSECVSSIAGLNTPLSMFTAGVYLAQTDLKKMFLKLQLYKICVVRLLLIPLISLPLLSLLPEAFLEMKLALFICAACPTGSNIAVYAQLHQKNYSYAVETVVTSTLFSVLTLPIMVGLASVLWR